MAEQLSSGWQKEPAMAQMTVRNLDEGVYEALKARARRNHRSLEAEARAVLERAARDEIREEFLRWSAELRDEMRPHYHGDATADIREDRESR
jgi:plasmid stability protein